MEATLRPKLQFARIKREVNILDVVRRYGITLKGPNKDGWYSNGKCPLRSHESKGSNASFAVNGAGNFWVCHSDSCKKNRGGKNGGDVITLVALAEGLSFYDAAAKLTEWYGIPTGDERAEKPAAASAPQTPKPLPGVEGVSPRPTSDQFRQAAKMVETGENKPLAFTLKGIDPEHEYLRKRGISPETAKHFGIGFFPGKGSMSGRIVIPIHNAKGELIAYAGRALNGDEPRYKLPEGFHKTRELFNLHQVSDQADCVLVVEGYFDCFKIWQAGFPNVVALMGCTASPEQLEILVRFKRVILCLDGDEPGRTHQAELLQKLAPRTFVRTINLSDGKQPDMLSSDELKSLLAPVL